MNSTIYPKITVVTPSFNQGAFLEETILSVLGQGYPNLEYIIIDGGSSDESVEIIRRYEDRLAYWQSKADGGQSDAINQGFDRATGAILAWLNSDDFYLPGTLFSVARKLRSGVPQILFGNCIQICEGGTKVSGSDVEAGHTRLDLPFVDYIIQPSSFWTRQAWDLTGKLDHKLHYVFDWDWYIRAQQAGVMLTPETRYLSVYRLHKSHKTGMGGNKRLTEIAEVLTRYAGRQYGDLYRYLSTFRGKYNSIRRIEKWISRLRLTRYHTAFLRLRFPILFRGLSDRQLASLLRMVEPAEKIPLATEVAR